MAIYIKERTRIAMVQETGRTTSNKQWDIRLNKDNLLLSLWSANEWALKNGKFEGFVYRSYPKDWRLLISRQGFPDRFIWSNKLAL